MLAPLLPWPAGSCLLLAPMAQSRRSLQLRHVEENSLGLQEGRLALGTGIWVFLRAVKAATGTHFQGVSLVLRSGAPGRDRQREHHQLRADCAHMNLLPSNPT